MKTINLITLPALFLFCTGLIAQDTVDNPAAPQDVPEATAVEQAETAVQAVEDAAEAQLPAEDAEQIAAEVE